MLALRNLHTCILIINLLFLCTITRVNPLNLSRHPILVVISFDAFHPDYLSPDLTPNLYAIKLEGVSTPYMKNQFPTFTFPNHQSMATGLFIESHGIVSQHFFDPLLNREIFAKHEGEICWNFNPQVVPIWTLNEWQGEGRHSGVMMWPGSSFGYGKNNSHATHTTPFDPAVHADDYPMERRIDDILGWIIHDEKPANLVFAYFTEPDHTSHENGPQGNKTLEKIRMLDKLTGYLGDKLVDLGIVDRVNLMFVSDHGMALVKLEPQFVIHAEILVSSENGTRYEIYSKTPVLHILPKKLEETREIYEEFKEASKKHGHLQVYLKHELKTLKPKWHYTDNRRITPILLVADVGYAFQDFARTRHDSSHDYGQHGYDNECKEMRALFMAIGPLFKSGGRVLRPFDNIDLFALICQVMDISCPAHNGTLSSILPILRTEGIQ